MIKIEKNLDSIPESLIPAYKDLFPEDDEIPILSKTTHQKRMLVIANKVFIDKAEFTDRYKKDDIRTVLRFIYKNKCAFCEQKIEQYHVEHYRPKKIYYWLAFSWDNLIMACSICNQNKGTQFDLNGNRVKFVDSDENIKKINQLSASYDEIELPKMINPEVVNPIGKISFKKDGKIQSDHPDFSYTIEKCKIDRNYLNDERRKLLDIFERDLTSALLENKDIEKQKSEISTIIRKFIRDSKDDEMQFLSFRRFAIFSGWLNEMGKSLN